MSSKSATGTVDALRADTPAAIRGRFREALSRVGSSVVVITSADHTRAPVGMTVGTFTSISMEPPLVGFFAGKDSSTLAHILESGTFCANVLSEDQHLLARSFARSRVDKFSDVEWMRSRADVPLLSGAHAWIECSVDDHRPIGDHELVVGRVESFVVPADTDPLIFHQSAFHGLRAHR